MSESADGQPDEHRESEEESGDGATEPAEIGWLEKTATVVSGLLVASLLGVLGWDAVHPNTPPAFVVQYDPITVRSGSYRAPVTVRNTGDESARSVVVHLELLAGDSSLAESDLTIDWLPGRSSNKVIGLFEPPGRGVVPTGIRAAVRGYAMP